MSRLEGISDERRNAYLDMMVVHTANLHSEADKLMNAIIDERQYDTPALRAEIKELDDRRNKFIEELSPDDRERFEAKLQAYYMRPGA
jgi:hypothetical protein